MKKQGQKKLNLRYGKHTICSTMVTEFAIYRLEKIPCGKPGCTKCPHGPYWYGEIRNTENTVHSVRKTKSSRRRYYIGKRLRFLQGDSGKILSIDGKPVI